MSGILEVVHVIVVDCDVKVALRAVLDRQSSFITIDGLLVALENVLGIAQIVVSVGLILVQLQSLPVLLDSQLVLLHLAERVAKVVESLRLARIELDGSLVVAHAPFKALEQVVGICHVVVDIC